ncbi:hypothetical protein RJ639_043137 [Escallonia herrerae]|uniref:Uncharacterized protein n=1 Tax=Escallonia herrerae TaxID=1293975 RepID=A0AA88WKH6_9ASTE|nr:hypothetical protein RJ639_043137 [Escallonia herrerae]
MVMYKSSNIASKVPETMATKFPVEIGTRGTVGSLIMQEIEYFSRLELDCRESSQIHTPSASENTRPKHGSMTKTSQKKKRARSRLIPSMCSVVEVAESSHQNVASGFSYSTLKADVKRLQLASSDSILGLTLLKVEAPLGAENVAVGDLFGDDTGVWGAHFIYSNSLDIRALIVPVVPTLIDPPPPLIASNV